MPLLAVMTNIEENNGIAGKQTDVELSVAFILPKDLVLKIQSNENNKRSQAHMSDTNTTGLGSKNVIGTSSVHLCWHPNPEYKKLSQYQKN